MVSKKKKGRGKAKKAAKKAEEKQEAAANEQQGTPDAQMQQLTIDEDALLEEAIKLAAAEKEEMEASAAKKKEKSKLLVGEHGEECGHGYVKTEDHFIIENFANTFISGSMSVGAAAPILDRLQATVPAIEKYPEVWRDSSKLKLVLSSFISTGTQRVLKGDINGARTFAFLSCHLQEHIAVNLHQTKAIMDAAKVTELASADERTLVKYLRKNIPCKCLDEKYKQVKSVTKMGYCWYPHCQVPDKMVERRTMVYCTRCRLANYCSRECQEAAWPEHKESCDEVVGVKAKFNSKQKKVTSR